jgi:hypothetical protein
VHTVEVTDQGAADPDLMVSEVVGAEEVVVAGLGEVAVEGVVEVEDAIEGVVEVESGIILSKRNPEAYPSNSPPHHRRAPLIE